MVVDRTGIDRDENQADRAGGLSLPEGVSAEEAQLILYTVARVKAGRFGRLTVAVSDGRLVDVEIVEKMDRRVLAEL